MTTQTLPAIEHFRSDTGVTIYRIPMEVFPNGFIAYAYVLLGAGPVTLVDTGSGIGRSTDDLLAGLESLCSDFNEKIGPKDIERVIITHGHVDHFGGLSGILEAIGGASVGIHPLDRRVLTNYDERVLVATKNLTIYLKQAGIREERLQDLLSMYGFSKQHVRSTNVDFMFEEGDIIDGMEIFHVPGHCSGQVAIRIGDILLSADHILSRTSPHLAAESITHNTGLSHYRESLRKMRRLEGIRLTLGGHEEVMDDLHGRIDYLQQRIDQKLERVIEIIQGAESPLTISDISKRLYREKHGFEVLLAIQEAGAHVEYLYDRGYLAVPNIHEIETDDNAALQYTVL